MESGCPPDRGNCNPRQPPDRGIGVLKPTARALQGSLIRRCRLAVLWFSQRCPVVLLEPDLSLDNHTFNDFSKTKDLIEKGKQWTEDYLLGERGEWPRSFAEP